MSKIEWASLGLPKGVTWGDGHGHIAKTGKAGSLLDGKEYSEFPEAR